MPYPIRNMLVDEQDGNVLSLGGVGIEGRFNSWRLGLGIDNEEVFL